MLGPPVDVAHTALAVGMVSAACVGLLLTVPTEAPPDAPAVAASITTVAAATPPASVTLAVDAEAITIAPHRITLHRGSSRASAPLQTPLVLGTGSHLGPTACSPEALRRVTAPQTLQIDGPIRIVHRWCGGRTVVMLVA
jgi:hypothetical protein